MVHGNVSVLVDDDGLGGWALLEKYLQPISKLPGVRWRHTKSEVMLTIPVLHLSFERTGESPYADLPNLPLNLNLRPYAAMFVVHASSQEAYRDKSKAALKEWLDRVVPRESECEWLVVVYASGNDSDAARAARRIGDRVRSDFSLRQNRICMMAKGLDGTRPDAAADGTRQTLRGLFLDAFLTQLLEHVRNVFLRRCTSYEAEIKRLRENANLPGWSFCSYFAVREGLAMLFEQFAHLDDALRQYEQLAAFYEAHAKEISALLTVRHDGTADALKGELLKPDVEAFRNQIIHTDISTFELRRYMLARRLALLLQQRRLSDAAILAQSVTADLVLELQDCVQEGEVPALVARALAYRLLREAATMCVSACDDARRGEDGILKEVTVLHRRCYSLAGEMLQCAAHQLKTVASLAAFTEDARALLPPHCSELSTFSSADALDTVQCEALERAAAAFRAAGFVRRAVSCGRRAADRLFAAGSHARALVLYAEQCRVLLADNWHALAVSALHRMIASQEALGHTAEVAASAAILLGSDLRPHVSPAERARAADTLIRAALELETPRAASLQPICDVADPVPAPNGRFICALRSRVPCALAFAAARAEGDGGRCWRGAAITVPPERVDEAGSSTEASSSQSTALVVLEPVGAPGFSGAAPRRLLLSLGRLAFVHNFTREDEEGAAASEARNGFSAHRQSREAQEAAAAIGPPSLRVRAPPVVVYGAVQRVRVIVAAAHGAALPPSRLVVRLDCAGSSFELADPSAAAGDGVSVCENISSEDPGSVRFAPPSSSTPSVAREFDSAAASRFVPGVITPHHRTTASDGGSTSQRSDRSSSSALALDLAQFASPSATPRVHARAGTSAAGLEVSIPALSRGQEISVCLAVTLPPAPVGQGVRALDAEDRVVLKAELLEAPLETRASTPLAASAAFAAAGRRASDGALRMAPGIPGSSADLLGGAAQLSPLPAVGRASEDTAAEPSTSSDAEAEGGASLAALPSAMKKLTVSGERGERDFANGTGGPAYRESAEATPRSSLQRRTQQRTLLARRRAVLAIVVAAETKSCVRHANGTAIGIISVLASPLADVVLQQPAIRGNGAVLERLDMQATSERIRVPASGKVVFAVQFKGSSSDAQRGVSTMVSFSISADVMLAADAGAHEGDLPPSMSLQTELDLAKPTDTSSPGQARGSRDDGNIMVSVTSALRCTFGSAVRMVIEYEGDGDPVNVEVDGDAAWAVQGAVRARLSAERTAITVYATPLQQGVLRLPTVQATSTTGLPAPVSYNSSSVRVSPPPVTQTFAGGARAAAVPPPARPRSATRPRHQRMRSA